MKLRAFGASAGPRGLGYYSFAVGEWTILSLNSNVAAGPGSAQADWARPELERLRLLCLAGIGHPTLISSGAGPPAHAPPPGAVARRRR